MKTGPRIARVRPPIDGQVQEVVSLSDLFYPQAETTDEKRHRRRKETLSKALAKMRGHQEEPYCLQDLARDMYLHPRHVQRIFSSAGSKGFAHEMRRIRLQRARQLLLEGFSISEISTRLQYSHPSHFSKAFQREYGLLPSRWRSVVRKSS